MRNILLVAVAAAGLLTATAAHAGSNDGTVELPDVVASALQRGPEAVLPEARRLEGKSQALGVTSLPDLEIETLATVQKSPTSNTAYVQLTQPLRPSDFGARRRLAESLRTIANGEAKAAALDLIHKVTQLYTETWVLQERENLNRRNLKNAADTEATLKKAMSEGRGDRAELDLFSAEKLRLDERIREIDAARLERLAELGRLAALSSLGQLSAPDKKALPASFDAVVSLSETPSGLRQLFQTRMEMAQRRLAVARDDSVIGTFAPRLNVAHDYALGGTTVSAGVVLSLPVWSRNQSEVAAAEAVQMQAQAGFNALNGGQYEEVLRQTYLKARRAVSTSAAYYDRIVPAFRAAHGLAIKRFQAGQASVLDLWTVRERLTGVEEEAIAAVAASVDARLALETLIGNSLEIAP
jgi:outer membrane protein TolC